MFREVQQLELQGFSSYSASSEGWERLEGEGHLLGGLGFKDAEGLPHYSRRVNVTVRPENGESQNALSINVEDGDESPTIEVFVPRDNFRTLRSLPDSSSVVISFRLDRGVPLSINDCFQTTISVASVTATVHRAATAATSVDESIFQQWVLKPQSQLGVIAKELALSMERWLASNPRELGTRQSYLERIGDLVQRLRAAVPRQAGYESFFQQSPQEFNESLKQEDVERVRKLSADYDWVWHHRSAISHIQANILELADTQELATNELEAIAQEYLEGPGLKSGRLETLLISALVFNEVVAFARSLPWLPKNKPVLAIKQSFWQGTKRVLLEGLVLFLTGYLASAIDPERGLGFWAVMATITLVRWLRPNAAKQQRERLAALLNDMASIQNRLSRDDFNARQVRDLLYDVERRGAMFSPSVFNLLDRRIDAA